MAYDSYRPPRHGADSNSYSTPRRDRRQGAENSEPMTRSRSRSSRRKGSSKYNNSSRSQSRSSPNVPPGLLGVPPTGPREDLSRGSAADRMPPRSPLNNIESRPDASEPSSIPSLSMKKRRASPSPGDTGPRKVRLPPRQDSLHDLPSVETTAVANGSRRLSIPQFGPGGSKPDASSTATPSVPEKTLPNPQGPPLATTSACPVSAVATIHPERSSMVLSTSKQSSEPIQEASVTGRRSDSLPPQQLKSKLPDSALKAKRPVSKPSVARSLSTDSLKLPARQEHASSTLTSNSAGGVNGSHSSGEGTDALISRDPRLKNQTLSASTAPILHSPTNHLDSLRTNEAASEAGPTKPLKIIQSSSDPSSSGGKLQARLRSLLYLNNNCIAEEVRLCSLYKEAKTRLERLEKEYENTMSKADCGWSWLIEERRTVKDSAQASYEDVSDELSVLRHHHGRLLEDLAATLSTPLDRDLAQRVIPQTVPLADFNRLQDVCEKLQQTVAEQGKQLAHAQSNIEQCLNKREADDMTIERLKVVQVGQEELLALAQSKIEQCVEERKADTAAKAQMQQEHAKRLALAQSKIQQCLHERKLDAAAIAKLQQEQAEVSKVASTVKIAEPGQLIESKVERDKLDTDIRIGLSTLEQRFDSLSGFVHDTADYGLKDAQDGIQKLGSNSLWEQVRSVTNRISKIEDGKADRTEVRRLDTVAEEAHNELFPVGKLSLARRTRNLTVQFNSMATHLPSGNDAPKIGATLRRMEDRIAQIESEVSSKDARLNTHVQQITSDVNTLQCEIFRLNDDFSTNATSRITDESFSELESSLTKRITLLADQLAQSQQALQTSSSSDSIKLGQDRDRDLDTRVEACEAGIQRIEGDHAQRDEMVTAYIAEVEGALQGRVDKLEGQLARIETGLRQQRDGVKTHSNQGNEAAKLNELQQDAGRLTEPHDEHVAELPSSSANKGDEDLRSIMTNCLELAKRDWVTLSTRVEALRAAQTEMRQYQESDKRSAAAANCVLTISVDKLGAEMNTLKQAVGHQKSMVEALEQQLGQLQQAARQPLQQQQAPPRGPRQTLSSASLAQRRPPLQPQLSVQQQSFVSPQHVLPGQPFVPPPPRRSSSIPQANGIYSPLPSPGSMSPDNLLDPRNQNGMLMQQLMGLSKHVEMQNAVHTQVTQSLKIRMDNLTTDHVVDLMLQAFRERHLVRYDDALASLKQQINQLQVRCQELANQRAVDPDVGASRPSRDDRLIARGRKFANLELDLEIHSLVVRVDKVEDLAARTDAQLQHALGAKAASIDVEALRDQLNSMRTTVAGMSSQIESAVSHVGETEVSATKALELRDMSDSHEKRLDQVDKELMMVRECFSADAEAIGKVHKSVVDHVANSQVITDSLRQDLDKARGTYVTEKAAFEEGFEELQGEVDDTRARLAQVVAAQKSSDQAYMALTEARNKHKT